MLYLVVIVSLIIVMIYMVSIITKKYTFDMNGFKSYNKLSNDKTSVL